MRWALRTLSVRRLPRVEGDADELLRAWSGRERAGVALGALAWLAFVLAIAMLHRLPDLGMAVFPLVVAPGMLWEQRRTGTLSRNLVEVAKVLAATYATIAAGLLLGLAMPSGLEGVSVACFAASPALLIAAVVAMPKKAPARRSFGSGRAAALAVSAVVTGFVAMWFAGQPDPGPAVSAALVVVMLILGMASVLNSMAFSDRAMSRTR